MLFSSISFFTSPHDLHSSPFSLAKNLPPAIPSCLFLNLLAKYAFFLPVPAFSHVPFFWPPLTAHALFNQLTVSTINNAQCLSCRLPFSKQTSFFSLFLASSLAHHCSPTFVASTQTATTLPWHSINPLSILVSLLLWLCSFLFRSSILI